MPHGILVDPATDRGAAITPGCGHRRLGASLCAPTRANVLTGHCMTMHKAMRLVSRQRALMGRLRRDLAPIARQTRGAHILNSVSANEERRAAGHSLTPDVG